MHITISHPVLMHVNLDFKEEQNFKAIKLGGWIGHYKELNIILTIISWSRNHGNDFLNCISHP